MGDVIDLRAWKLAKGLESEPLMTETDRHAFIAFVAQEYFDIILPTPIHDPTIPLVPNPESLIDEDRTVD